MDLKKTAREIGLFETAINLAKVGNSVDVIQKVGASMPLPDEDIEVRIGRIADWLLDFGKSKYWFLTPEIALIEEMRKRTNRRIDVIIAVPCDLDMDAKERLLNNLPHKIEIAVLEEIYFPQALSPKNGMMVLSGYLGADHAMVLPDTYRMIERYSNIRNGFLGKKVFVPYKELDVAMRYDGWMEINQQSLSAKWRNVL